MHKTREIRAVDSRLRSTWTAVHERVKLHEKGYVACLDPKDRSGTVYDVEVGAGKTNDRMEVREVYLHKVDGKPVSPTPR
jgi:hypothetical protein